MPLIPVAEEVAHTASLALATRAERGGATARGVVIATALSTGFVTEHEVAELRDWHARHPDAVQGGASTMLAGLYGGAPAREVWPPAPRVEVDEEAERAPRTAAAKAPLATKLAKLSATVNRTNRQTAARLHSAATVALGEAIRQATGKMIGKARTASVRASIQAADGVYTRAHYAAVGLTEQDLLDKRFDTFAAYAASLIAAAERRKLNAAASALGVDRDEVEAEYGPTIDSRATAAAGLMVVSLGLLARQELSGHQVTPETAPGEFSGPVPFGIVRNALDVASKGASVPFVDETGPGPSAIDELSATLTGIGETLVEDLLAANDVRVQVRSTWAVGAPDRPFEPHQALEGVTWVDTQPDELAWDEGEFPFVSVLQPGDHVGCDCEIVEDFEPYDGDGGGDEGALVGVGASGDTPE